MFDVSLRCGNFCYDNWNEQEIKLVGKKARDNLLEEIVKSGFLAGANIHPEASLSKEQHVVFIFDEMSAHPTFVQALCSCAHRLMVNSVGLAFIFLQRLPPGFL